MTNEERVQAALEAAMPEILSNLKKEITEGISYQVRNEVTKKVIEVVNDFVSKELAPEISTILLSEKEGILKSVPGIAENIVETLGKALQEKVKDKLSTSYSRNSILKALFD
jgi:hypothetical protein